MNPHLPTQIASIDQICSLYHTDERFQTVSVIQIYSLRPDSIRIRNDQRCTIQSDQIFQYHDVKRVI